MTQYREWVKAEEIPSNRRTKELVEKKMTRVAENERYGEERDGHQKMQHGRYQIPQGEKGKWEGRKTQTGPICEWREAQIASRRKTPYRARRGAREKEAHGREGSGGKGTFKMDPTKGGDWAKRKGNIGRTTTRRNAAARKGAIGRKSKRRTRGATISRPKISRRGWRI